MGPRLHRDLRRGAEAHQIGEHLRDRRRGPCCACRACRRSRCRRRLRRSSSSSRGGGCPAAGWPDRAGAAAPACPARRWCRAGPPPPAGARRTCPPARSHHHDRGLGTSGRPAGEHRSGAAAAAAARGVQHLDPQVVAERPTLARVERPAHQPHLLRRQPPASEGPRRQLGAAASRASASGTKRSTIVATGPRSSARDRPAGAPPGSGGRRARSRGRCAAGPRRSRQR